MKKELNNNYLQIKTILKTTLVAFILMLFFIPASNLQAQNGDIDVTFHLFTDSYQVSYNFGDTITEIPSNQFLENNNVVFEGWYLDDFYGGDNYYGKIVDNNTPTTLYPRLVSKFPEEEYGSYTVYKLC